MLQDPGRGRNIKMGCVLRQWRCQEIRIGHQNHNTGVAISEEMLIGIPGSTTANFDVSMMPHSWMSAEV
jgi:hypothetical protein